MEDFGYVKDENKKDLSQLTRKIALSCATIFSISCFIYITISAYSYVYEEENNNVETIKSPEMPIKVIEEDQVAIRGDEPKINDSIYEDIFGNKKESLAKAPPRIRLSPEPALPPKNLAAENKMLGESVPNIDTNEEIKEERIEKKPTRKAEQATQQQRIIVYSNQKPEAQAQPTNASQDLLTKGKVAPKAQEKHLSDQSLDKPKPDKRRYVRVQIAALTSKKAAEDYWKKISGSSRLFSDLKPFTEQVDLGKKGIFYRLQIGNFSDQVDAESFCKKYTLQMQKNKADCIVVE